MDKSQDSESDSLDRLSELPDSLIISILSLLLSTRDVIRTTILSKRWKDVWTTVPCLYFQDRPTSSDAQRNFISGALAQWKGAKIQKFGIFYHLDSDCYTHATQYSSDSDTDSTEHLSETSREFDSWLLLAIEKQVEELIIDMGCYVYHRFCQRECEYCAPQSLYSCSSITKLSLFQCKLIIEGNVQWNQLKSLTIDGVESWSEDTMNRVISGAPQLEKLNLTFWKILENLNIRSSSLKKLEISGDGMNFLTEIKGELTIWAPNLTNLKISGYVYGACLLDVPSLTNAHLCCRILEDEMKRGDFSSHEMLDQVFPSVCHVEKVTLSEACIKFLLYMKENGVLVLFPNAKFLSVYAGEVNNRCPKKDPILKMCEMLAVFEMFPNLKKLITDHEEGEMRLVFEEPKASFPSSSLPQLKTADISWCIHDPSLLPAVGILLKSAHVLEKMVLKLYMHGVDPKKFILAKKKVLRMPRSSRAAQVIVISERFF
ncbi:putative F-box/FBD/LRR-repeat protein At1g66290 [Salvia miltiorrhiza]|uniref:putative F-box/FBD/LRR-repeat protein At1g66290 n=1 Tax=Salvia miltiorrhiza TaxID=226208 RepID=UPI0025AB9E57|nr:putative F-box/FBD/LRR-repeat protein At1g66290 [Salvia miltiorrhiza]